MKNLVVDLKIRYNKHYKMFKLVNDKMKYHCVNSFTLNTHLLLILSLINLNIL